MRRSKGRIIYHSPLVDLFLLYLIRLTFADENVIFHDKKQALFVRGLEAYKVVLPSRIDHVGQFASHNLHPSHAISRRSLDQSDGVSSVADDTLYYQVFIDDRPVKLSIRPNKKLISPGFVVERKSRKFGNITDSEFKTWTKRVCHFIGEIDEDPYSKVAVDACNGLTGLLHTNDTVYFIEPVKGHNLAQDPRHPHIIYKRSALPDHLDLAAKTHPHHEGACGVKDNYEFEINKRDRWQRHIKSKDKRHRRKRSISTEKHVETLVVVDPKMVEYHRNDDIETYVLTIMNMVSTMFHDSSIGNAVNIVIVRLILLEDDQPELKISHHADNTLNSFCKWQKQMNFKDEDHPNHHDIAVLFTRYNICSRLNEPCSTLGLAQVAGLCQPHRSCNINEDTGLALAFTVSHELGHNFGMKHDNIHNHCEVPIGEKQYVMASHLIADSTPVEWSNCSRRSITKFLDRDWGYCLDDEPADHDFKYPVLPPGTMYDADHQCRLQYGEKAAVCVGMENICSTLWCRVDNKCTTKLEAAGEGTLCGPNKWCYSGDCVEIGEREISINGGWGEWGGWAECTRSCGAGVSHSQRHCDNPPPSNGGKYCLGERKRYRICNTEKCPKNTPSFRTVQCEEFNYMPYKNRLFEWETVLIYTTPCQLHCKPKNQFFSVMLKDLVTDGTPCIPGGKDMCISGRCRHVGCDWVLDSAAKEDRCGVCHGDGSTCKMVKNQFNDAKGLGYVEATVIPINARNIRVEEVAEANNYLALRNDKGEYYLNGHWFIQWSGDYKLAGTIVHYRREGNKESFNATGPLLEPLHIMLLFQSHNPGISIEYTVPNENATDQRRTPEFHWKFLDWTHCTSSCGGGTQRSRVICVEIEAGTVEDIYCNTTKADDKLKTCNGHMCPARWWAGPWQHCSVSCGDNGIHRRTVICVRRHGSDEQIALEDSACADQEKLKEEEPCHKKDPCPGWAGWVTGDWSNNCNDNPCGEAHRQVACSKPKIGCEMTAKPDKIKMCSNISCGHWTVGEWSQCTSSCNTGIQYRKVMCTGGQRCNLLKEPATDQKCNVKACPTTTTPTTTSSTTTATTTVTVPTTTKFTIRHRPSTKKASSAVSSAVPKKPSTGTSSTTSTPLSTSSAAASTEANPDSMPSIPTESRKHQSTQNQSNIHVNRLENDIIQNSINEESQKINKNVDVNAISDVKEKEDIAIGTDDASILFEQVDVVGIEKNTVSAAGMPAKADNENSVPANIPEPRGHQQKSVVENIDGALKPVPNQETVNVVNSNNIGVPDVIPPKTTAAVLLYDWKTEEWTQCTRHCGGGIRARAVTCTELSTNRELSQNYCSHTPKPPEVDSCHSEPCQDWKTTEWSHCSATCGYATQRRHIYCPVIHMCDPTARPEYIRECKLPLCVTWVSGQWSRCSQTCDGGYQERLVECVNQTSQQATKECSPEFKPENRQKCGTDKCQTHNASLQRCTIDKYSHHICATLKRMKQCQRGFVRRMCCRTCRQQSLNNNRPNTDSN